MLNKIFIKNEKYLFIINNFFQLFYFIFIIKEFNIKNYIFIIPNYKNYLKNFLFFLDWINYIILNDIEIRKIPFSFIDIIKHKKKIKKIFSNKYQKYKIIATTNNNILNKLLLWYFKNNEIFLINTTPDSLIKKERILYDKIFDFITCNKNNFIFKLNYFDLKWEYFYNKYKNIFDIKKIKENLNLNLNKDISIFLWQNHKELWLSDNIYNNILLNIKKEYKNKWIEFYIKPHPLDNFNYLEFNLIDKKIPWELLNLILKPERTELLTFFSSTILSIKANKKNIIKYEYEYNKVQKALINKIKKWI
jgi:hypothetical protein